MSIIVGPLEIPFNVHLGLICDCSPYFNKLFKDRYTVVKTEPIRLPDDNPDTFAEFLCWAYRGVIFQSQPSSSSLFTSSPLWIDLCRLWVLADKFEVRPLQDLVIKHCQMKHNETTELVEKEVIDFVYRSTPPDSPLRQMMVAFWTQRVTEALFSRDKHDLPRPFLEDLCLEWMKKPEQVEDDRSSNSSSSNNILNTAAAAATPISDRNETTLSWYEFKEENVDSVTFVFTMLILNEGRKTLFDGHPKVLLPARDRP
jgi:hypothetical protein